MNDNNSLAHTKWNCKYHIVFAPKYRRKIFYGEHKEEIGKILRELCNWKQVKIIEAEGQWIKKNQLENYLVLLSDLDYKIKRGKISNKLALEMFIMDICR